MKNGRKAEDRAKDKAARQLLLLSHGKERSVPCRRRYWITPPELLAALDAEFGFDFDPCPSPLPEGFNGLDVEWGSSNYVNPPYRPADSIDGRGAPAFIRKAIVERAKGKASVIVVPVTWNTHLLLEAGAEVRTLGRVAWLDVDTGDPLPKPRPTAAFILRGDPARSGATPEG